MKPTEEILRDYFGFASFREGQQEIIDDILQGNSVLGVLPTGSGKSICYQIPSIMLEGVVIVISPLLSLMEDQIKQLKALGMKDVVAINSFLNEREKEIAIDHLSAFNLIYVSPEMIQNRRLMKKLQQLTISLFVIDEAHCISQWGHEFRPDYLKLSSVIEELDSPPVLALSATATPDVQVDIMEQLQLTHIKKHIYPMDRENIAFSIRFCDTKSDKINQLVDVLSRFAVPTMIYFSSKKEAETVASILEAQLTNLRVAFYHGGMESVDRTLIQQQFMENQLDVICCTSAFGMGINKSNVRLVIHYHLPTQIESFIQEIGRAGRDGLSSASVVLYSPFDELLPKRLIDSELPSSEQMKAISDFIEDRQQTDTPIKTLQELTKFFEFNEIQWRFLQYQLEKHGILKENRMMPIKEKKKEFLTNIEQTIVNRYQYKHTKLTEMLSWIEQQGCRRKSLYQPFQAMTKPPKYFCCDVCDFDFNKWQPKQEKKQQVNDDWKKELANLFLQDH